MWVNLEKNKLENREKRSARMNVYFYSYFLCCSCGSEMSSDPPIFILSNQLEQLEGTHPAKFELANRGLDKR